MIAESEGGQIKYDTLQENPVIKKHRNYTNICSAIVASIFIVAWIILGIFVLSSKLSQNVELNGNENEFLGTKEYVDAIFKLTKSNHLIIIGGIILTTLLMITTVFVLRVKCITQMISYLAVFSNGLFVFLLLISILLTIVRSANIGFTVSSFVSIVTFSLIACFKIAVLLSVKKVGVQLITGLVNEASRITLKMYCAIIISFVASILATVTLIYGFFVLDATTKIKYTDSVPIYALINIIGTLFTLNCILYFAFMTTTDCVSNWYWTVEKNNVSKSFILQSTVKVARYHFGSLAFGSSMVFPFFHTLYLSCKDRISLVKDSESPFIRAAMKLFLTFSLPTFALKRTAIYGTDYIESAKKAFEIVLSHCSTCLAVLEISSSVMGISVTPFVFLAAFGMSAGFETEMLSFNDENIHQRNINTTALAIILSLIIFLVILPFFMVLYSAVITLLFCTLKDLEENNGSAEKPYYMNYELQRILTNAY